MDSSLERFHDFAVVSSELGEGSSLLLENVHDRFERMAIFELASEGMGDQFRPCLFLIALQGNIEEHLKLGARNVAHYSLNGSKKFTQVVVEARVSVMFVGS
jgi:hypothetical protein